mmetsp:Transcript_9363/g.16569  ORF Transcript_9363/g.16569 Transcript_9363/m.16569 type:complete len:250 (-) Transcript_9363:488-1237(-)
MSFGKGPSKHPGGLSSSGLTKETQALLDDALKKRGLSLRATKDVAASVAAGSTDWIHNLSTCSSSKSAPPASKSQAKVKVPYYRPKPDGLPAHLQGPPASFSGIRMQQQMPCNEREQWPGGPPAPDRELQKEHLAQVMEAGGADKLREKKALQESAREAAEDAAARHRPVNVKEAMIDHLVQEVAERREFLEAMRATGHGGYEAQIKGEMQQRLSQLRSYGVDVSAGVGPADKPAVAVPAWQRVQSKQK